MFDAPEEQSGVHEWPHRVHRELELGDDTEVASPAAKCPVQIGILAGGRIQDPTVGGYDPSRHEVVAAQAVLPRQPSDAPAEREPRDAGVADDSARHREPVFLRRRIELGPRGSAAAARADGWRVDGDRPHRTEVDHQSVVDDSVTGEAVAAATNGDLERVLPTELDRGRDVVGVVACAISAGLRSMSPFHSARASS